MIERASPTNAKELTELTMRSKAHWGYSADQMLAWKNDLTISEDYIRKNEVFVFLEEYKIIGYYSTITHDADSVLLDNLFIDPDFMGAGYGSLLVKDFLERAKKRGVDKVTLHADPHAEGFYSKFGFETIAQIDSSIARRTLPMMEFEFR